MSEQNKIPIKLPCDECGGRCCCPPAFNDVDALKISTNTTFKVNNIITNYNMLDGSFDKNENLVNSCPAFNRDTKKCTIYEFRPTICRLFGSIPKLPCLYLHSHANEYYTTKKGQLTVFSTIFFGE